MWNMGLLVRSNTEWKWDGIKLSRGRSDGDYYKFNFLQHYIHYDHDNLNCSTIGSYQRESHTPIMGGFQDAGSKSP